jgi:fumarate reductase subunit C
MNDGANYTPYHPRWLRTRVSTWWWIERWSYLRFILRELSSVFVAWFVLFFLLLIHAIIRGDTAYQDFLEWSRHPVLVVLNTISMIFILFHAITWFNLTPAAMAVRVKGRRVPPFWIAAPNYVLWAAISIFVAWLLAGNR